MRLTARAWLLLILLALAVFAGLLALGDLREMQELLAGSRAPYGAFAVALGLALVNYYLRYLRWALYLRVLGIRVPRALSVKVFCAGLALSITPGKVGELLKSVWLQRRAGVPVAASAPAVVMERLTDVGSVALLGLFGALLLPPVIAVVLLAVLTLLVVAGVFAASRYGALAFRLPVLRRWREPLELSQEQLRLLLAPRVMAPALGLGAAAWAAEGLALWALILGLGEWIAPQLAIPISAAAALVGAATALPGGLVGFEGSMVALLAQSGLSAAHSALATLLTRLATLWFAVLIGFLAFLWLTRTRTASDTDAGDTGPGHSDAGNAGAGAPAEPG